jgi:hypothetical protein
VSSVIDVVADVMRGAGVPQTIWGPIMSIESGGSPTAALTNSSEDSIGLFALNRSGGLGSGYTVAQLQDPKLNASIAASQLGPNYKEGTSKGLTGLDLLRYVAYNSGFPTMQGTGALRTDQVVKDYDIKLQREYNSGEGGGTFSEGASSGLMIASSGSVLGKLGVSSMSQTQKYTIIGLAAGIMLLVAISE